MFVLNARIKDVFLSLCLTFVEVAYGAILFCQRMTLRSCLWHGEESINLVACVLGGAVKHSGVS